ncbi:hypothetical protein BJF78_32620 [Pseudonocardia sp. CNS-139]|nr:hypothetical protein BJF78_32620 [Pseudonocardia sp. CNS-139]
MAAQCAAVSGPTRSTIDRELRNQSAITRRGDDPASVSRLRGRAAFVEDGVLRGIALRHPGGVQIAFGLPTREDVAAWSRRLDGPGEAHQVVDGHMGGAVIVGLRDPDGVEVRLYSDETATGLRVLALPGGQVGYTDGGAPASPSCSCAGATPSRRPRAWSRGWPGCSPTPGSRLSRATTTCCRCAAPRRRPGWSPSTPGCPRGR